MLDVVYNHLGPEGNYLGEFGPYFTDRYQTPWGDALNFDGPHSDEVRRFFIENALHWIDEFHIDALARSTPCTPSSTTRREPFLAGARRRGRTRARERAGPAHATLIAESDLNDAARHHARRSAAASASTRSGATTSTTRCTRC